MQPRDGVRRSVLGRNFGGGNDVSARTRPDFRVETDQPEEELVDRIRSFVRTITNWEWSGELKFLD